MNSVNNTMYIPLYGKAYVSKKGIILSDKKAEEIWAAEGFALKGKAKSKWLAYYMGIRCAVFDEWLQKQMDEMPDAAVIHIGCGMDGRILRTGAGNHAWYDVDFPEVIAERKRYYSESDHYHMLPGDARKCDWLQKIPENQNAVVVMEGISMYLTLPQLHALTENLCAHFRRIALLMDCYTVLAAKMSKYKNPVHGVGVEQVYGIGGPQQAAHGALSFVKEHPMTPEKYIHALSGWEKLIFRSLYAGRLSKKLYRLYEYRKK